MKKLFLLAILASVLCACTNQYPQHYGKSSGLPLPHQMALVDYETELYEWVLNYKYKELEWKQDKGVRDTGPFIGGKSYGTHGAVRIFYSPEMMEWLAGGRKGPIKDGAMIIKESYTSPAAIYQELATDSYSDRDTNSDSHAAYEDMLEKVIGGWVVMVKDSKQSADGWFWGSVELAAPVLPSSSSDCGLSGDPDGSAKVEDTLIAESVATYMVDTALNRSKSNRCVDVADDKKTVSQLRWSGTAMPCMRCHASAESELTFSDLANVERIDGVPGTSESPLIFRVDDSWRTKAYFSNSSLKAIMDNPNVQQLMQSTVEDNSDNPNYAKYEAIETELDKLIHNEAVNLADHSIRNNVVPLPQYPLKSQDSGFLKQFPLKDTPDPIIPNKTWVFPPQWMDHVEMPADHNTAYITSDNCVGCHGGLPGSPNRDVMFVPSPTPEVKGETQQGYNVSEFGEWRWSPMGLAGRDPIFHSQLESEMALLKRDATLDMNHPDSPPLLAASLSVSQQAVTDKCLTCHGAMGERQLRMDIADKAHKGAPQPATANSGLASDEIKSDFKIDYFYLPEALTAAEQTHQKDQGVAQYAKYGALAREGISCMICHRIDGPSDTEVNAWNPGTEWLPENLSETNKELAYNLFHRSSGEFKLGPLGEVFGQFDDVQVHPMQNALRLTPKANDYTSNSQMCGNCHTINLPNIGAQEDRFPVLTAAAETPFKDYKHSIEQATFVEWQNSASGVTKQEREELGFNSDVPFKSCQDCHMPTGFESVDGNIKVQPLTTQIASIQDSSYPAVGHSLANEDINIPVRDDYKRHTHVGLNVFLLSMMDQFSETLLGVSKSDYMTGVSNGTQLALDSMISQAINETVDIAVSDVSVETMSSEAMQVQATVSVTNKTGHRYPSGVAFRRAFIEFTVRDGNKDVIWQSGGTNPYGVIIDGIDQKQTLPTEFLPSTEPVNPSTLKNKKSYEEKLDYLINLRSGDYQPHHGTITKESQVQIYEELNLNAQGDFTSSFVHRVFSIKDNRLLPRGWRESKYFKDQGEVIFEFMESTMPEGFAERDNDYKSDDNLDFAGTDTLKYIATIPNSVGKPVVGPLTVTATLYNQSIPPYWLKQRFRESPKGKATQRLRYMASRLDLKGTQMEDWKLKLRDDCKVVHLGKLKLVEACKAVQLK